MSGPGRKRKALKLKPERNEGPTCWGVGSEEPDVAELFQLVVWSKTLIEEIERAVLIGVHCRRESAPPEIG